jgi:hypothetical protein
VLKIFFTIELTIENLKKKKLDGIPPRLVHVRIKIECRRNSDSIIKNKKNKKFTKKNNKVIIKCYFSPL